MTEREDKIPSGFDPLRTLAVTVPIGFVAAFVGWPGITGAAVALAYLIGVYHGRNEVADWLLPHLEEMRETLRGARRDG